MIRSATRSGLRYRGRHGQWVWSIIPIEFLQLSRECIEAGYLQQVREATK